MAIQMKAEQSTARTSGLWTLPLLINDGNKILYGLILAGMTALLYLTSNHIHIFVPRLLPMTSLDTSIPFIPHTMWIYISEYLLFFGVYMGCRNIENLNRYAYSFFSLQVLCSIIFWTWPTTYPRELFPLPGELDSLTYRVFSALRVSDSPANCCPSLHVSSVYLSSFMFLKEQRHKFPIYLFWASAIAVTTLTTKQHYIVDVIAGLLSAIAIYWFYTDRVSYQANR